jgi:single stranded DNA-binding protein
MPTCVNKVILVGNVGKDPEVSSPSGTPIAKFSLATNERFEDRSGEWQERVEWHTIVASAATRGNCGRVYYNRIQSLYRGEAANLDLGRPAKRPE